MQPLRIWDRRANTTNCYVDFFKDFTIVNITTPLILKLYADTEYVVYCNGRFVARGQYRCFPNTPVYDTIDLTAYAQAGYNRLAITVYYQGELSYQYAKGDPGLWFTLYQEETCLAVSDSSVLSAPSKTLMPNAHRITHQYGFGFIYNALEETDWRFSNGCLSARFIHAEERGTLSPSPRPIQKCTIASPTYGTLIQQGNLVRTENGNHPALAVQTDQLFPCEQSERSFPTENPYFIWDLGREMAGFIQFTIHAPAGTIVDLAWGEHINEHGVTAVMGERNFANRYIAKEGEQTFTYYFRRIAGRYLQMHIAGRVNALPQAALLEETYPVKMPPLPDTGNQTMNTILHTARETLRQCMHEHYEDCPWREQALYAGDSWNQILCGYYAFHETKFPRACLDLIGQSMRENGFLAITAPTDEFLQIPSFTFIWIMSVAKYTEYTGDLSLAEQYFPSIRNTLYQCTESLPDGIAIHPFGQGIWNFYEWRNGCDGGNIFEPEPFRDYSKGFKDGLYQMFLYAAIESGIALAKALSDTQSQAKLSRVLQILKQGIHHTFWNETKQRFASFITNGEQIHYCQLMQAMAVFNNLADQHTDTLCEALISDDSLIPISRSYAIYLYEGLLRQGDTHKEFVWNDILANWGAMLDAGATTFWETELGAADFEGAGSLCHGWSAVPLYIICRYFMNVPLQLN